MPSDGVHTIQVFGNDSIGTIYGSDTIYFTIDITKEPSEPTIHGYDLWILIGIITITSLMVIRRRIKK